LIDDSGARRGASVLGTCTWERSSRPNCELTLTANDIVVSGADSDFFDAFCRIREVLAEQHHLVPLCYGASRFVWPSGMCRDMGLGLKAYHRKIGDSPDAAELVPIFSNGPDVEPVSVAEQQAYAKAVLDALLRR
jgi:hypothetical protein